MTRTLITSRSTFQICVFSAVFAAMSLMAVATSVDAKERKRIYNKDEFVLLCNSQDLKVICDKKSLDCSCDDQKTILIWRNPTDHPPGILADPTHGPVGDDETGAGSGTGRGRN